MFLPKICSLFAFCFSKYSLISVAHFILCSTDEELPFTLIAIFAIKPKEVQAGGPGLADLTNVTLNSNGVWSWDAFPGTYCYFVKLGTYEEFSVYETNVNLYEKCRYWGFKSDSYPIEVYAADSYGNALTHKTIDTYNYVAPYPQLATPTNIKMNGKKLTWNSVQYATGYIVEAYNELGQRVIQNFTENTYFDYSDKNSFLIGNEYHFRITAVDESATMRPNSEIGYSNYFEGWFIKGNIEDWQITSGVASWKEINQANNYAIVFWDEYGQQLCSRTVPNNSANLYKIAEEEGLTDGTYGLLVWALDGDFSELTNKLEVPYVYEANKYCTVYFHLNDGQTTSENIVPGGYAHEPTSLHKVCCKMNGWYFTDTWEGLVKLDETQFYYDTQLYGFWEFLFQDIEAGRWYLPYVDYVYNEGLMTGYEGEREGEFGPNDTITRGQLVTILYRYAGKPEVDYDMNFMDIKESESGRYYYYPVKWAASKRNSNRAYSRRGCRKIQAR